MSTRGGWRVALRLARREATRRKAQTALMLVLICLPVLAVTTAAIVWRTADVSSAESVERRLGTAEALLETTGMPRVAQAFDPNVGFGTPGGEGEAGAILGRDDVAAVLDVLGDDRPVITFERISRGFETDKGIGDFEAISTDLASPLTDGLFEPVRGQFPPGPGEVVVNQALADRGPGIGDTLTVIRNTAEGEQTLELAIVGIAESAASRGYPHAGALPGAFGTDEDPTGRWLVGGGPVTWDDVQALNVAGVLVTSRAVLSDPPPESALGAYSPPDEPVDDVTLTVLALVVVMVLIEVVLLAGPAFAVRAKAQAHTLALVAAAGGTPRQARRTVLASGVVIGSVGGVLGVVLGIATATIAVPITQRLDSSRFGPFEVPWSLLTVVAGFGLLSAVLAAVVPAFSASRHDIVAVLAGRRGEGRPSTRSPFLGLALLATGIAGAVLGSAGGRDTAPLLIAGSALLSVFGMILLVPMTVALVSRAAAGLPLALRFAARDAARHRTRTVPAVAAVGATVAGVVALGIAVSSQEASNRAQYQAQLPDGHGSVVLGGDVDQGAVEDVLDRYLPADQVHAIRGVDTTPDEAQLELEFRQGDEALLLSYWSILGSPYVVGDVVPDYVPMSPDTRVRSDAVLAEGGLVLLQDPNVPREEGLATPELTGDQVTVAVTRWDEMGEDAVEVGSATAPGTLAAVDGGSPALAVLSPRLVRELGLTETAVGLLLTPPISADAAQDIEEELAALDAAPYSYVERGYQSPDDVRIIQLVLAALGGILMLGGTLTATFLALSDARPDLATMAAVGARPRERRRVAAAYALVVGGVGALLGAPIGFIPGLAVARPLTRQWDTGSSSLDVPWLLIVSVVVGLPLLTAAAVGACARGRLPLTARVD